MKELREYGIEPLIADPTADAQEAKHLYGVDFVTMDALQSLDALVLAVAHEQFASLTMEQLGGMFGAGKKVLLDIKGMLDRTAYENAGYLYWRL